MFSAGFSRLDITPPLGTPIAGFFYERLAVGIIDPLELNAIAFNDGENTAVIVIVDALGVREDYATKIRNLISEELSIPADNVMIAATHSHTSFRLGVVPSAIKSTSRSSLDSDEYIFILIRKFVDAARLAIDDLKEATVEVGEAQTKEQVSFIRRYLMKDGSVKSFPKLLDPNIVRPMGEADNTLRLVRFNRKDGDDIVLTNFSTHPCVVSGSLFSADWPGYVRKYVEQDVPGVRCLMLVGAEGDTNHVKVFTDMVQRGPAYAAGIGRKLADAAIEALGNTKPVNADKVSSEVRYVYNKTRTDGMEKYDEAKALYYGYYNGTIDKSTVHEQDLAGARRILNTKIMPEYQAVPVTVMGIGDVAFVGFGGEPFTEYANRARRSAPDKYVISAACANGFQGYLPTKAAFEDGGYESVGSFYTSSLEDEICGAAEEMLKSI